MLIRISLIVAILASVAVAGISFAVLKPQIDDTLKKRDEQHSMYLSEQDAHRKAQKLADDTKKDLTKTQGLLATAVSEREAALVAETNAEKAEQVAIDNLKKTQAELETTKDKLGAWLTLGIPVSQAKAIIDSVKATIAEKEAIAAERDVIFAKCNKLQDEIDFIKSPNNDPEMPAGLKGKVIGVDPRYDFVVLNIGSKQGARLNGKLLVHRSGKLVAKVWITDNIKDNTCVANVLPGWKQSDIMEGDDVFY